MPASAYLPNRLESGLQRTTPSNEGVLHLIINPLSAMHSEAFSILGCAVLYKEKQAALFPFKPSSSRFPVLAVLITNVAAFVDFVIVNAFDFVQGYLTDNER